MVDQDASRASPACLHPVRVHADGEVVEVVPSHVPVLRDLDRTSPEKKAKLSEIAIHDKLCTYPREPKCPAH